MTTHTTREAATAAGATTYYTGKPCKRGHTAERYVSNGACIECGARFNATSRTNPGVLLPAQYLPNAQALETVLGWIDEVNAMHDFPPAKRSDAPPHVQAEPLSEFERMLKAGYREGMPPWFIFGRAVARGVATVFGYPRTQADYPGRWDTPSSAELVGVRPQDAPVRAATVPSGGPHRERMLKMPGAIDSIDPDFPNTGD